MQTKKLLKIIIPIFMVAIVGAIWLVQTTSEKATAQSEDIPTDFALNAASIDLPALKEYELPIIIDFGADSCVPCKEMAPVLISLNEEMQEKAIIKFVDVWKNVDAADDYPVQVIPTQVFFNADGTAYEPSDEVKNLIPFQKYSHSTTGEHVFTVHQGGLTEEQMRMILDDMGVV